MKFIVLRTSPTGKKLAAVAKKLDEALEAQKKLSRKWGFTEWRNASGPVAAGGMSAIIFPKNKQPDKKNWKNVNGSKHEWMPKWSTKEGNRLYEEIKKIPVVSYSEVNDAVGFDGGIFKCVGFDMSGNNKYFGITAKDDWKLKPSKDLKEVTVSEYQKLFKKKE